jgi:hypothetical protein
MATEMDLDPGEPMPKVYTREMKEYDRKQREIAAPLPPPAEPDGVRATDLISRYDAIRVIGGMTPYFQAYNHWILTAIDKLKAIPARTAPPVAESPEVAAARDWCESEASRVLNLGYGSTLAENVLKLVEGYDALRPTRAGVVGVPEKYYACFDYGSCNDGSHSSNVVECDTLENAQTELASHRSSLIIEDGWASIIRGVIVQEFRDGQMLPAPVAKEGG